MTRSVIRVAALGLTAAIVITGSFSTTVSAATTASVLPSGGGILATGSGTSLKDITAERARSAAMQKAQDVIDIHLILNQKQDLDTSSTHMFATVIQFLHSKENQKEYLSQTI